MPNQTQPLTPAQAQELAKDYHDLASAVGNYRLDQVFALTSEQQYQLQAVQFQYTQYSNQYIAAGLFARQTDLAATLQTIKQQTTAAGKAISTIKNVDHVLQIATAAAILGASIASLNPSAVATGVEELITAIAGTSASPVDKSESTAGLTANAAAPSARSSPAKSTRPSGKVAGAQKAGATLKGGKAAKAVAGPAARKAT